MNRDQRTIVVFGATGRQGGSVARALKLEGWRVRAVVRDSGSPPANALQAHGIDLVVGNISDPVSIRSSFADAYGVFSVLPGYLDGDDEVNFGRAIADLAAENGVQHFIYSSGASVGEEPTGVPRFDAKPKIERHVRELPIPATIVRPMIFMEMLLAADYGLAEGRFEFLVRPDQAIQLVALEDIGRFVAAIFADPGRFGGQTLTIASDTVTGADLGSAFSDAIDRPIAVSRLSEAYLAKHPDVARMVESLEDGPLSRHADLADMRELNPSLISFRSWLAARSFPGNLTTAAS